MREIINRHGKWIAVGGAVLAILFLFLFSRKSIPRPTQNPSYGFFVDETTGEESVLRVEEVPPLPGKDGKLTVVRAFKFTCDNGETVEVHHYLKYPPEIREALAKMSDDDFRKSRLMESAPLVRLATPNSPWVSIESAEGQRIIEGPTCSGGPARIVYPSL
jgi:hypothetical protein